MGNEKDFGEENEKENGETYMFYGTHGFYIFNIICKSTQHEK